MCGCILPRTKSEVIDKLVHLNIVVALVLLERVDGDYVIRCELIVDYIALEGLARVGSVGRSGRVTSSFITGQL